VLKRRPKGVKIDVLGHLWGPKGCQEGTKKGVLGRLEALLVVMRVQGAFLESMVVA